MTDQLSLYNGAARHLGVTRFLNLTENRQDRRELDAVYDAALLHVLAQAGWKFALNQIQVEGDDLLTPDFGSRNVAVERPDDFVRLAGFSTNEDFNFDIDFDQRGNIWYITQSPAYLTYVSSDDELGLNLDLYGPNYTEAVEAWLAYEVALPVTKDRDIKRECRSYYEIALRRARELESIDDRVKFPPNGKWVGSRGNPNRVSFPVPGKMHIRG